MLVEINRFIKWQRRRNANARTWRDYQYDLKQFVEVVGDKPPGAIKIQDIDRSLPGRQRVASNPPPSIGV